MPSSDSQRDIGLLGFGFFRSKAEQDAIGVPDQELLELATQAQ